MKKLLFLSIALLGFFALQAQVKTPIKWTWESKHVQGNEFDLVFTANINSGWALYSQYLESEDGPVATSFEFESPKGLEKIGKNKENGAKKKEGFDELFGMNLLKYYGKATFTQRVNTSKASEKVAGYLTFMTCDDNQCLPPTDVEFNFNLEAPKKATKTGDTGKITAPDTKTSTASTDTKQPEPTKVSPPAVVPATKPSTKKVVKAETKPKAKDKVAAKKPTPKKVEVKKVAPKEEKLAESPEEAPKASDSKILKPIKWNISKKEKGNGEFELVYEADIQKGFYTYSQFQVSDDGPMPTEFIYDEKENIEIVGKSYEYGTKENKYDDIFDMKVATLKGSNVKFKQKVKLSNAKKGAKLVGVISYQVCDKSKCVPSEEPFAFAFGDAVIGNTGAATTIDNRLVDLDKIVHLEGDVIDQRRATIITSYDEPLGECGEDSSTTGLPWWQIFLFGFGGGLLALLTPCVFPMIPLTVSFFTKDTKRSGLMNALIYGLSIIVIYVGLGLLITNIFGPTALNALSTDWIANTIFFVIFVIFAFSFFGYYEITLPSSWANKSDSMADKGGLIGIFFMAATLAIVSFSCTGPIIGTALVESSKSPLGPTIVMLGFSTALALPFGLFAAFPAWLNSLPKSGSWMSVVKVSIGFIELALAFKFLSVADMTSHWGILGYEVFLGIWIVLAILWALYLFGFIRFPHDSPMKKLSIPRFAFGVLAMFIAGYLCFGFTINPETNVYKSPGLLSGLAPPAQYNYFLTKEETNLDLKKQYPSLSKCANGIDCFKDYYEGLAYAQSINKPVLIDFTGHGCVNCRKMEEHVWIEDPVKDRLQNQFVLISLYVDDREALEQPLKSKIRKVKLRNIGNKWSDFQVVNFNQNSQPLYVMMTPDEQVLGKPIGYATGKDVNNYVDFLDCGLNAYTKTSKNQLGSVE